MHRTIAMHRIIALVLATVTTAAAGCAADTAGSTDEDQAALAVQPDTTFTLTVHAFPGVDTVDPATGGNQTCASPSCFYAPPVGTRVTIGAEGVNRVTCTVWVSWTGACAGQGQDCVVTIGNTPLTVGANYNSFPPGAHCIPD